MTRTVQSSVVGGAAVIVGVVVGDWRNAASKRSVPNVDFQAMAIATRPVSATAYGTTSRIQIKAWERCALGVTACDRTPRTVEAICLGSGATVLIEESDWGAFQRISYEDLPGVNGLAPDMKLCRPK